MPPAANANFDIAAMEVLGELRAALDGFPLEQQITIVKALTARTILNVVDRMQARSMLSA